MTGRRRLSPDTRAALRAVFGGKACVLTGRADNIDWHHLDEDPSHAAAANIVPLERDLNLTLEAYRQASAREPVLRVRDERLTPAGLGVASRHWFRQGHAGRAYGASRLATWLVIRYPPLFADDAPAITSICASMRALRHAACLWLLDDVLVRDVRWAIESGRLDVVARVRLLVEFASIYQDVLALDRARALLTAAECLLGSVRRPPAALQARVLRRSAINRIVAGQDLKRASLELERAADASSEAVEWVAVTTAQVWLAAARSEAAAAAARATELARMATTSDGMPDPLVATPWSVIELFVSAVGGGANPRRRSVALDRLATVAHDPAFEQIRMRPVAARLSTAGAPVDAELLTILRRHTDRHGLSAASRRRIDALAGSLVSSS